MITKESEAIFKRECQKCHYQWFPRVANTKRCPNVRCQAWLDNTLDAGKRSAHGIKIKFK